MGISLGNSNKKPYVGSKEVQEAYVGSQLVYRATPPYVYGFLGGENDYIKADWVTLDSRVSIVKFNNIYRLSFGGNSTLTINLAERKGSKISVALACSTNVSSSVFSSSFYDAKNKYIAGKRLFPDHPALTTQFTSFSVDIPSNAAKLEISASYESSPYKWYADMIYQFD